MAKPKLPSGAKFKALKAELAREKGVTNPAGLAAYEGRRKLGKAKFQALAAEGQRIAARRRAAGK